jgi:hypothetical protein
MNKSSLSQLLDGAAFPVIMLAVAVSQIKVEPNRKDALRHGGRVTAELRWATAVNKTRRNTVPTLRHGVLQLQRSHWRIKKQHMQSSVETVLQRRRSSSLTLRKTS